MSYKSLRQRQTALPDDITHFTSEWPDELRATDPGPTADQDERRAWYDYARERLLPLLGVPATRPVPDTDLGAGNRPASGSTDWRHNTTPKDTAWAPQGEPSSVDGVEADPVYSFQRPGDVPFPA